MRMKDANVLRTRLEKSLQRLGNDGSALSQCLTVVINAIDELPEIEVVHRRRRRSSASQSQERQERCVNHDRDEGKEDQHFRRFGGRDAKTLRIQTSELERNRYQK